MKFSESDGLGAAVNELTAACDRSVRLSGRPSLRGTEVAAAVGDLLKTVSRDPVTCRNIAEVAITLRQAQ